MNQNNVSTNLLRAIELVHYSRKFEGKVFLLNLNSTSSLQAIIPDLKVLTKSYIKCIIVCEENELLDEIVKSAQLTGSRINTVNTDQELTSSLKNNECTIRTFKNKSQEETYEYSCDLAKKYSVDKLFFIEDYKGIKINNKFISYITFSNLEEKLKTAKNISFNKSYLSNILMSLKNSVIDLAFIENKTGTLFEEIFTHEGHGTLISHNSELTIRRANKKDIENIIILLQPSIEAKLILPVSDSEIIETINDYIVHTVNEEVVACAKLKNYETMLELGKLCTQPRYRGTGKAIEIIKTLLRNAEYEKKSVFTLSTNSAAWKLFESLGFSETSTKELPLEWQNNYDESRKSKAFIIRY